MITQYKTYLAVGLTLVTASAWSAASYQKVDDLQGQLTSVGSDTLEFMMHDWSKEFSKIYPGVKFSLTAKGSSTAPGPLTEGTSNFGPMSRKMKAKEVEAFEFKNGYQPTPIRVAIDALGIFVHKDNPVKGLTIQQLDGIFSKTYKCGGSAVNDWSEVSSQSGAFNLYSRNNLSGTYGYFTKKALCKGSFRDSNNELDSSEVIVKKIAADIMGIGYSGLGYKIPAVKTVPIAKKAGQDFVPANTQNAASGKYPLSRYLYIYVNKAPGKPLPKLQAEFIKFVLSEEGQKIVVKDGYVKIPSKVMNKDLNSLK